jgi:hypothetical protein
VRIELEANLSNPDESMLLKGVNCVALQARRSKTFLS